MSLEPIPFFEEIRLFSGEMLTAFQDYFTQLTRDVTREHPWLEQNVSVYGYALPLDHIELTVIGLILGLILEVIILLMG